MTEQPSGKYWDRAWSLVDGCTPVSAACENCWLQTMTRFSGKNFADVQMRPDRLDLPERARKPKTWAVWSDLFHENVPFAFIDDALNIAFENPRHTYLFLTKRPERLLDFYESYSDRLYFDRANIWMWFGTTVENQEQADKRIPMLMQVPVGRRFLSMEPLLGDVDIRIAAFNGADSFQSIEGIHWITCGGESGPKARPVHPRWIRAIRFQCEMANIPFHFKSWGEWAPDCLCVRDREEPHRAISRPLPGPGGKMFRCGRGAAGRMLDGKIYDELPWRNDEQAR